jgi:FtsP/CotA-like multicopper oxidase with cupredoxin domain
MAFLRSLRRACVTSALLSALTPCLAAATPDPEPAAANDNTRAAGTLNGDTLTLRLRAAAGAWRPEGEAGPALQIEALGEAGSALTVPAPLIRVTEGTTIAASIRNELTSPLRVHGLCARDGAACAPLDVPPGGQASVRFSSGRAGTYHYWATSMGAPVPFREMAGAIVVDPAGARPEADRIFVITEWTDLTPPQLREIVTADDPSARFLAANPRFTFVVNGLSWPATERLTYREGDPVRWRVINLSSQIHPMHLHGFYFTVTHTGDGQRDDAVAGGEGRRVVTQLLPSGGTMTMRWIPERAGNWLFHCHVMHHVSPERRLEPVDDAPGAREARSCERGDDEPADARDLRTVHGAHEGHDGGDPSLGMAGMVLGITVLPRDTTAQPEPDPPSWTPRTLTLAIERGSTLAPLVLHRGESTEITLVNHLDEPTSMHWHGLELESFYDGVHGWSGEGRQVAPMIAPGGTFTARIAPPRTGTFIYHTHLHDYRQLTSGLYGPLIVVEPGETFDPAVDHVVILGRRDASPADGILKVAASAVINGEHEPSWTWAAKTRHRVRLINITPDDIWTVSLAGADGPVTWRPLTKDGAPVPDCDAAPGPARATIAVGETYDFEVEAPAGRRTLWLEVRGTDGRWQAQARVLVR